MLDRRGFLRAALLASAAPAVLPVLKLLPEPIDDGYLEVPAGTGLALIRDLLLPGLTSIQVRYDTLSHWREIFPT